MFKYISKFVALAIAVCMLFALTACGSNDVKLISKGKLTIGTSADFPPFEYIDGGGYAGIDIEIMEAIAEKMGLELVVKDIDFDSLPDALAAGEIDLIIAAMTVNADREEQMDFTNTYFTAKQTIIVKAGSNIKGVDDLEDKIIGGQAGNVGITEYANDLTAGENIKAYANGALAVEGLILGDIDAIIIDDFPAQEYKNIHKDEITLIENEFDEEEYAIGVKKGNKALVDKLNKFIGDINDDGTYKEIRDKYITG